MPFVTQVFVFRRFKIKYNKHDDDDDDDDDDDNFHDDNGDDGR